MASRLLSAFETEGEDSSRKDDDTGSGKTTTEENVEDDVSGNIEARPTSATSNASKSEHRTRTSLSELTIDSTGLESITAGSTISISADSAANAVAMAAEIASREHVAGTTVTHGLEKTSLNRAKSGEGSDTGATSSESESTTSTAEGSGAGGDGGATSDGSHGAASTTTSPRENSTSSATSGSTATGM